MDLLEFVNSGEFREVLAECVDKANEVCHRPHIRAVSLDERVLYFCNLLRTNLPAWKYGSTGLTWLFKPEVWADIGVLRPSSVFTADVQQALEATCMAVAGQDRHGAAMEFQDMRQAVGVAQRLVRTAESINARASTVLAKLDDFLEVDDE